MVHRAIDGDPNLVIPLPTAWLSLEKLRARNRNMSEK
jgi:hypothetical protein